MEKFIINETQLIFLEKNITNTEIVKIIKESIKKNKIVINGNATNRYYLNLSKKDVEIILNELTLLFTLKGIKENGEPNILGLDIENLIDVFFQK